MPQFVGIDLAWGEGSPRRAANETGLATLDEHGRIVEAGWARGIDAVIEWLIRVAGPGAVIAVDAPLVVSSPAGMRECEKQVGRAYGRWHVYANASNTSMGWQAGVTLRRRLEQLGFVYTDGIAPAAASDRTFFECYPYTTIVGTPELGYDDKRPRYKRLDLSLPRPDAREARASACDELIRRFDALTDPPVELRSHPIPRVLVDEPSPINDREYKHREDLLDAVICAWTAATWARHGESRTQILGRNDPPGKDGLRATIVAPARESQRLPALS